MYTTLHNWKLQEYLARQTGVLFPTTALFYIIRTALWSLTVQNHVNTYTAKTTEADYNSWVSL